uniref:Opioid growth factor receptor (OGFr) conserved domain-containing protein n=1 Tax=Gouania willdenowi TaxID=441366 RepID=A0A8C5EK83_GOUWI
MDCFSFSYSGISIKDFHNNWRGRYDKLEYTHTFIQWLFPLREPGMNSAASPLTEEEVEAFCQSHEAKANLLESYKLMLDFYGMELCNDQTGEVKRAENWEERFNNLNYNLHNSLRITRIIKCLGILGYRHLQAPLVHFFLKESLVKGELPYVKDSILNYFMFAVLDKGERKKLVEFAYFNYHPKDEFVWCSEKIQMQLQQKHTTGCRHVAHALKGSERIHSMKRLVKIKKIGILGT